MVALLDDLRGAGLARRVGSDLRATWVRADLVERFTWFRCVFAANVRRFVCGAEVERRSVRLASDERLLRDWIEVVRDRLVGAMLCRFVDVRAERFVRATF